MGVIGVKGVIGGKGGTSGVDEGLFDNATQTRRDVLSRPLRIWYFVVATIADAEEDCGKCQKIQTKSKCRYLQGMVCIIFGQGMDIEGSLYDNACVILGGTNSV